MIKAIFFDIDGTLVSFRTHHIPQSALEAISEARQKGIKIFIATGRPMPFIDNLGNLEYDGILSVNGACFRSRDGKTEWEMPIDADDVRRMVEYQQTVSPIPVAYANRDGAFISNPNAESDEIFTILDIKHPDERPAVDALGMDVLQIIAFFHENQDETVLSRVLTHCDTHRWHPYFADCIAKGHNKATGIDRVLNHYGISIEETAAFGDGGNDCEMLAHVGLGIAMGNAPDTVKSCAKMVTDGVDEDGVAKAVRRITACL